MIILAENRLTDLSRTVAHALRHEPDLYGILLDPESWVAGVSFYFCNEDTWMAEPTPATCLAPL